MSFATYPSLNQSTVFITGAASGIGEETLRAFATQGARLGFIDMDEQRGQSVAEDLRAQGVTIAFERCDLRDVEALKRAFASLEKALGPAAVLVNNAARDDRHSWEKRDG